MGSLNKVTWYLNRLASMSIEEVGYRIQERILIERERVGWRIGRSRQQSVSNISKKQAFFLKDFDPRFFFKWHQRTEMVQLIEDHFPDAFKTTLFIAEELCQHQIEIFGSSILLGENIDWHADPLSQKSWPITFAHNIDTRDGNKVGGVKWVWELNRHHHLVTLAKAYFLSGNEKYAREATRQLEDWIINNPPLQGVNWTSALELAIRLINWIWTLAFLRNSSALTPSLFDRIMQSMVEQASYIARHLSAHSSANNHLIGEAAGLALVGLCFPGLPEADAWQKRGIEILTRELELQILPDGVPAEQAISYLSFVLDFNLLVWRLAELNGFSVPAIWYQRLEAACDFLAYLMDEKGNVPQFGDSDDAHVVRLDDRPVANNYKSILATGSVLLKRPDLKVWAGDWDEKSHWLLGNSGLQVYEEMKAEQAHPLESRVFTEGGYCIMRLPNRLVLFDCGPLGYLSTAAHGHADALSLVVHVDGRPFLIDPGTYAYQEGGTWRDYFRSTGAHNTIVVDGQNQSEMRGTFLWGHKAEAQLECWKSSESWDFAVATHNGYEKMGVVHRRSVLFLKSDWLLVVDDLLGNGEHHVDQRWHLSGDSNIAIEDEIVTITLHGKIMQFFQVEALSSLQMKVASGEKTPILGWESRRYGSKEPAPVIRLAGKCQFPVRLVTAFCLNQNTSEKDAADWIAKLVQLFDTLSEEVKK